MNKNSYILSELFRNLLTPMQLGTKQATKLHNASSCLMFELLSKDEWIQHKGKYFLSRFIKNCGKNTRKTIDEIFIKCLTDNKTMQESKESS